MAISDWVKIGNTNYDVTVTDIAEVATILYTDKTDRTMAQNAKLTLDPLGTFFSHQVTFKCIPGKENHFEGLYNYVTFPRFEGIDVEIVHGQQTISYKAYISTVSRKIKRIDEANNRVHWDKLQVNFVPVAAQLSPYSEL